ncbi:hypothetical protein FRB90_010753 [Tulasnella sp. 427]|nr:hypothetical protein FRB90_010753 [Tulasnella sp. 427]
MPKILNLYQQASNIHDYYQRKTLYQEIAELDLKVTAQEEEDQVREILFPTPSKKPTIKSLLNPTLGTTYELDVEGYSFNDIRKILQHIPLAQYDAWYDIITTSHEPSYTQTQRIKKVLRCKRQLPPKRRRLTLELPEAPTPPSPNLSPVTYDPNFTLPLPSISSPPAMASNTLPPDLQTFLTQLLAGLQPQQPQPINVQFPATTTVTNVPAPKAKVKEPDVYNGKARGKAATRFLLSCKNYFQLRASDSPDDSTKISFAVSYLSGTAQAWAKPILTDLLGAKAKPTSTRWKDFEEALEGAFGDPDAVGTAIRELEKLVQGNRPAANYASDFRRLMADIPWDEKTFMHMFKKGLKEDVKDAFMYAPTPPADFNALVKEAIKYDNRIWERKQERSHHQHPAPPKNRTQQATTPAIPVIPTVQARFDSNAPNAFSHTVPVPIHVDVQRRGRVTQEERQRRQATGACFYCGQTGHMAKACPSKRMAQGVVQDSNPFQNPNINPFAQSIAEATIAAMSNNPFFKNVQQTPKAKEGQQSDFPESA